MDVPAFEPDGDVELRDTDLYLNRDLSELAFQRRVLHEALDESNPVLERVRFLAIITRNLDEFVMKRIGGLKQGIEAGVTTRTAHERPSSVGGSPRRARTPVRATDRVLPRGDPPGAP